MQPMVHADWNLMDDDASCCVVFGVSILKAKTLKMWNQQTIATFHRLLVLLSKARLQTKNVIGNTTDCQTSCRWLPARAAQNT
jgi:hypothetical protein